MSETLMIIDDDKHINDMLYEVLTREGYRVLRAFSGTTPCGCLPTMKLPIWCFLI